MDLVLNFHLPGPMGEARVASQRLRRLETSPPMTVTGTFGRKLTPLATAGATSLKSNRPSLEQSNRRSDAVHSHSRRDFVPRAQGSDLSGFIAPIPSAVSIQVSLAYHLLALKQLKTRYHPTGAESLGVIYQLARAAAHAAGLGVCHGSINPTCIQLMTSSLHVVVTGWDQKDPWRLRRDSASEYASPEQMLLADDAVGRYLVSDVWSIGMVFAEILRGEQLVKHTNDTHLMIVSLFGLLGTPSNAALAAFDAGISSGSLIRQIRPQPWEKVLKVSRLSSHSNPKAIMHLYFLFEAMLDWNPATREPAVGLLTFPFFDPLRSADFKYRSVTSAALTAPEIQGMVAQAFAAYSGQLAKRSLREAALQTAQPRKRRAASKLNQQRKAPLGPITEDPLGEVAWSRSGSSKASSRVSGKASSKGSSRIRTHGAVCDGVPSQSDESNPTTKACEKGEEQDRAPEVASTKVSSLEANFRHSGKDYEHPIRVAAAGVALPTSGLFSHSRINCTGAISSWVELNSNLLRMLLARMNCTSQPTAFITVVNLAPLLLAQAMAVFSEMQMGANAVLWLSASVAHGAALNMPLRPERLVQDLVVYHGGLMIVDALVSTLTIGGVAWDQILFGVAIGTVHVFHQALASPVWRSVVNVAMVVLPEEQERRYTSSRAHRSSPRSLLFGLMLPFVVQITGREWHEIIGILIIPALLCIGHRSSKGATFARIGLAIANIYIWRPLSLLTLIFSHGAASLELVEACSPSEVVLTHCLISAAHFCAVRSVRSAHTEATIHQELVSTQLMLLLLYMHIGTRFQVFAANVWCQSHGHEHQAGVLSVGAISRLTTGCARALWRDGGHFGRGLANSRAWHARALLVAAAAVLVSLVMRLVRLGSCSWLLQLLISAAGVGSLLGVQYVRLPPEMARTFWSREFDEMFQPFSHASLAAYWIPTLLPATYLRFSTKHTTGTLPSSPLILMVLGVLVSQFVVPVSVLCLLRRFGFGESKVLATLKVLFVYTAACMVCVSCSRASLPVAPDFVGPLSWDFIVGPMSQIFFVVANLLGPFFPSWQLVLLMCGFFLSNCMIGCGIVDQVQSANAVLTDEFPPHMAGASLVTFLVTSLKLQFLSRRAWLAESAQARGLETPGDLASLACTSDVTGGWLPTRSESESESDSDGDSQSNIMMDTESQSDADSQSDMDAHAPSDSDAEGSLTLALALLQVPRC